MRKENWGSLCLLVEKSGGEIYQWKRYKIGVYSLAKNSPDSADDTSKIFNYDFKEGCYEGMNDAELLADITALHFLGLIERKRIKLDDLPGLKTKHYLIKLKEKGKKLAHQTETNISKDQLKSLEEVAKDLQNKTLSSRDLLEKYASKWSDNYKGYIQQIPISN